MRNLTTIFLIGACFLFGGLACKNNPLAKFKKQYNCTLPGEPEPQTADEYVKRGLRHLDLGEFAAGYDECAFGAFSEAVRLDPNHGEAFAMRGYQNYALATREFPVTDTAAKQKHWEAAVADLTEAIRLVPDRANFYDIRSSIYEARAWDDNVIADLTSSLRILENARTYARRGQFYFYKNDFEKAAADYTEAIRLAPDNAEYYAKREEAYRKLGKNDLANNDDLRRLQLGGKNDSPADLKNTDAPKTNRKDIPKKISGGVLNGKAKDLVKPTYPAAARAVRASGAVNVQVTVDEQGDVISASAVSGHPLLRAAAVQAARESKFNPTSLSGQPVQVTGIIVYNFVPE